MTFSDWSVTMPIAGWPSLGAALGPLRSRESVGIRTTIVRCG